MQCNICDHIINKDDFVQHVKTSHKDNDRLNDIALTSEKVLELLKSENVFSMVDSKSFYCKFCSHSTMSPRNLFNHHQENHPLKLWQIFQCESCNYHTKEKKEILDHMKRDHNIDKYKPYKCNKCDYNFNMFTSLRLHIKRAHFIDDGVFVQCNICDQIINKTEFVQHVKATHKDHEKLNNIALSSEKVFDSLKVGNIFSLVDSKLFQCKFCSHSTMSSRDLFNHHQENHRLKVWQIFQCESCNYHSKGKKEILDHMKNGHNNENYKPYKCNLCDYDTLFLSKLRNHIERHNSEGKFVCANCGVKLKNPESLKCHIEICTTIFQCESCNYHTKEKKKILYHMKNEHNIDNYKPYKCNKCNHNFPLISYLKRHIERKHNYGEGCICTICGKTLKNIELLTNHTLRLHTIKERDFVCDICGFKTKMKNDLNRHKRMHKEKSLKCLYCDFLSCKKEQLEYHVDKKHQDVGGALSHMCPECGKGFIYKNILTKHLWKCKRKCKIGINQKMFQKPIWACPMCDDVLKNRNQFRNHMASLHQGEKPFKCLKCDTGFSRPENLKRHKCPYDEMTEHSFKESGKVFKTTENSRIHLKSDHSNLSNPHSCKKCNKGFATSELLQKHKYISHRIPCPQCQKMFTKMELQRHLFFRHEMKNGALICDICPKAVFFKKCHYNKHMVEKHAIDIVEKEN